MIRPDWHTSTYSNGGTNCVEVREHAHGADVRDTQHREEGHITFPFSEWSAFVSELRDDRL